MKWSRTCSLGLTMAGRLRRRMLAGGLVTRSWPAVMEWQKYSPSVRSDTIRVRFWDEPTACTQLGD